MVDFPSIRPFHRETASQMGGRSPSTATLHAKRRCRRDSVMTLPVGADGEGEGTAALTPSATTPCRADAKAWRAESDRPRDARQMSGCRCDLNTVILFSWCYTWLYVIYIWGLVLVMIDNNMFIIKSRRYRCLFQITCRWCMRSWRW